MKIINTGTVRNTVIADYATVENCTRLDNGTVNSNANAPVYIGDSVSRRILSFLRGLWLPMPPRLSVVLSGRRAM